MYSPQASCFGFTQRANPDPVPSPTVNLNFIDMELKVSEPAQQIMRPVVGAK